MNYRQKILEFISFYSKLVFPNIRVDIVKEDPEDNKFIECAVEGKVNYIVSGDKHLLVLNNVRGIKILSANNFLKEFRKTGMI